MTRQWSGTSVIGMTTTAAPRYRSAILNSLVAQQSHPMFRKEATVTQEFHTTTVAGRTFGQAVNALERTPAAGQTFRPNDYAAADAAVAKVAPGRYALPRAMPDGSGNMFNLFKVFSTRRGNMIRMLIATGGDDYTEVRLSVAHQIAAAYHIATDPLTAEKLYGQRTGRCSRCHRVLSNDESLALGIGPECIKK